MFRTYLVAPLLLLSQFAVAQPPEGPVQVNYQYNEGDTTRTFVLVTKDNDEAILDLDALFGEPVSRNPGTVKWTDVHIDGLGEHLDVVLYDGIMMLNSKSARFTIFKDEHAKASQLEKMPESRSTWLVIQNGEQQNVVDSRQAEALVLLLIERALKK